MAAPIVAVDILDEVVRRHLRRERLFRDRTNPLDVYDDVEIFVKYRFRRQDLLDLVQDLSPELEYPTPRRGSLSPVLQVLIGVRYLAAGSFQDQTGEAVNVSQPTVSRTVARVVDAILQHGQRSNAITLPTQREANLQKRKFFGIAGLPEIIGCIDGTHVRILAPPRNGQEYINRKNYHSINVQLVCDADRTIINCIAKWPGSVHDSRILREIHLFRTFESLNKPLNGLILGDSGYMSRPWLLTPYGNPASPQEQEYNLAHARTRVKIENCIGVLKKRWTCLRHLRLHPVKACRVIYACAILHNRANRLGLPEPEEGRIEDERQHPLILPQVTDRARTLAGQEVRARITRENFGR